jgi:homoserine kinase
VPVKIRVPASIANLGPGFDVLAMAVDLWLEVEAEPAQAPDWLFTGEGAAYLNVTDNPLSKLPMRGRVRNGIPLGTGLGSSAAARLAAGALRGMGLDEAFAWAAAQEGHADNVAAAAYGGVRLVGSQVRPLPAPRVDLALMIADQPASTDAAREVLPGQVPIADAVYNAGRLAMLVHAFHSGEYQLLGEAMGDRLHQPYRRYLYPWTAAAIAAARAAGAYGAAVAGAGPTTFALCPPGSGATVAAAMAAAAPGMGKPHVTMVTESGMTVGS